MDVPATVILTPNATTASSSCSGCPGVMILASNGAAHAAWHKAVGVDIIPPVVSPTQVTALTAKATATGEVTVIWTAPISLAVSSYTVARDGVEAGGGGLNWSGSVASTVRSQVFTGLASNTLYHFTVTPLPGGAPATVACTTSAVVPPVVPPLPTGADWASDFTGRAKFEKDWYPVAAYAQGGLTDPASACWVAGTNNTFYPFSFNSDTSAPGGYYIRLFCDRISQHSADSGKVGGCSWIGSSPHTRRGWSSGYVEFAARFPAAGQGQGMWPALWLYAQGQSGSGTDNTGSFSQHRASITNSEIDLVEIYNLNSTIKLNASATIHTDTNGNAPVGNKLTDNNWHRWGVYWDGASKMDFYYDGVKIYSAKSTDAARFKNQELVARLDYVVNLVSGFNSWAGSPSSSTPNSLYMDVAYVRHYPSLPF